MLRTFRRASVVVAALIIGVPLWATAAVAATPDPPFQNLGWVITNDNTHGQNQQMEARIEADGTVELFEKHASDSLWEPVTVPALSGGAIGTPQFMVNCFDEDEMHLFVVGAQTHHLYVMWQTLMGSTTWTSSWYDMGGVLTSNPSVYLNAQGRLEVFGRGGDNAVWTKWQTSTCGGWSNWTSLHGDTVSYPTAINWYSDGYVSVFDYGTDNKVWCLRRQTWASGWAWSPSSTGGC